MGRKRAAATVRLCDRDGCTNVGDRPAPKAPNSPERWMFCQEHAAEYNAGWDYFRGLTPEEAAARAASEDRQRNYRRASHWEWGGEGDGSRSRAELDALKVLGLEADASADAVKAAWRTAAKASHPRHGRHQPRGGRALSRHTGGMGGAAGRRCGARAGSRTRFPLESQLWQGQEKPGLSKTGQHCFRGIMMAKISHPVRRRRDRRPYCSPCTCGRPLWSMACQL